MKTFIENLSSLEWWIAVVVVGIAVNMASSYIKGPCDRLFGAFSKWWINRSDVSRKDRAERVARLRASKEEQILASIKALNLRIRSFFFVFFAVIFVGLAYIIKNDPSIGDTEMLRKLAKSISVVSMVIGMHDWFDSMLTTYEISEARRPAASQITD